MLVNRPELLDGGEGCDVDEPVIPVNHIVAQKVNVPGRIEFDIGDLFFSFFTLGRVERDYRLKVRRFRVTFWKQYYLICDSLVTKCLVIENNEVMKAMKSNDFRPKSCLYVLI